MKLFEIKIFLLFSTVFFLSCSSPDGPDTAGTGSKAGNALTGCVYQHSGIPVKNAHVLVIPANYHPIKDETSVLLYTLADTLGQFTMFNIPSGLYNIELTSKDSSMKFFLHDISINSNDTTVISDTLENVITVKGYIEQSADIKVLARVFIRGTSNYGAIDSLGIYLLPNMATGLFKIEVYLDSVISVDSLKYNHGPSYNIDSLYYPIDVYIQGGG
ncbi:MAG: carboxypeptidase-like regulatory domain-containing protein, partial [Elusimicrobiota bacterium]